MRLYFHLVSGQGTIQDLEGVEAGNISQALLEACRALNELQKEHPGATRDWSGWTLNITDADGNVILLIDLDRVIQ